MGNATNNSGFGFRVLKTHINSPAHEAGIQPFLDFIVNIELTHSELKEVNLSNIQAFFNTIKANENKEIHVTLFNIYDRQLRKIHMIPHKNWPEADSLLGVLLRYEDYITALERTYKVIQVLPGSEAEKLGFMEEFDYILGLTNYQYKDLGEFIKLLFKAEDVCVFNVKEGRVRFIQTPKEKCVLGCQFGEGILNQLPYKRYEMPMIEEGVKQHEEIVNLTEEAHGVEQNNDHVENQIKTSPKQILEGPPKKNEIHEKEHKSGIGLEEHHEAKNYQELLQGSSSKATLDYIHHKRTEHLKKNGPGGGRFAPKNPFQSPTLKYENEIEAHANEKEENLKENIKGDLKGDLKVDLDLKGDLKGDLKVDQKDIKEEIKDQKEILKEILKENIKDDSKDYSKDHSQEKDHLKDHSKDRLKENLKEDQKENLNSNEISNNLDNNLNKSEEKIKENEKKTEEVIESARFAKMVMKYSYYCPKLKDEYVISSSDLMQMTVKIE